MIAERKVLKDYVIVTDDGINEVLAEAYALGKETGLVDETDYMDDDVVGDVDEEVYDVKWSVKDNKITVIEKSLGTEFSYSGELKDNILTLYNGDESLPLTLQLVYERK